MKILAVTCNKIVFTDRLSYVFLVKCGLSLDMVYAYGKWAQLRLVTKNENYLDPWKLAANLRGESNVQCVGDDGIKRINVHCFHRNGGLDFAGEGDASEDNDTLKEFVKKMDDTIVLMDKSFFPTFEKVCQEENIELTEHYFEGQLTSA